MIKYTLCKFIYLKTTNALFPMQSVYNKEYINAEETVSGYKCINITYTNENNTLKCFMYFR